MIKNNFYPLRTIIGSSISIIGINPFPKATLPFKIEVRNHPNINSAVFDDIFSNFLPEIIKDGVTYYPIEGMNTMPAPDSNIFPFDNIPAGLWNVFKNLSDIPFPKTDSVASIFGYQEDDFIELQLNLQLQNNQELPNHFYSGRDRTYSFFILLSDPALIGGMCFNGYPYISSRIENSIEGMTVGNFGLPREIRLTPLPSFNGNSIKELTGFQRSQFIDSEFAYTRQEIISHSGLNYLTIDPVKTNAFLLTITDLPFIPKIIDLDTRKNNSGVNESPLLVKGYKGFAIPYLWFFEYKEQTKRNARLHSGLLGVKPEYPHLPKVDGNNASEDILRRAFPEWEYFFKAEEEIKENPDNKKIKQILEDEIAKLKAEPKKNRKREEEVEEQIKKLVDELKKLKAKIESEEPTTKKKGVYWVYTAHSALGQRREFIFPYAMLNYSDETRQLPVIRRKKFLTECFVSDLLQPNEKVILYLQQGEEYERCVAGLKALFLLIPGDGATEKVAEMLANLMGVGNNDNQLSNAERTFVEDALAFYVTLPPETNFCEEFQLRIYEVDPAEGISPAAVDLNSNYATLLADITVNDFMDVIFSQLLKGIPFRKTSSAKYFALQFTNTGQKAGQVAIHSLQMIRSANVSVQPRPAKTQQVKVMHYRIIGPELADDFSKLGNEGFNFSIDRVTAGQTKNVLYAAMSLLDLLHTGGARIHSNVRRRAVEFEMSQNFKEGQEDEYIIKKYQLDDFTRNNEDERNIKSWRSIESGKNVSWPHSKGIPTGGQNYKFETYSGIETRSRTELINTLTQDILNALRRLENTLHIPIPGLNIINNPSHVIFKVNRDDSASPIWTPFREFEFSLSNSPLPIINGVQTLSLPPFFNEILSAIATLNLFQDPINSPGRITESPSPRTNTFDDLFKKLALINGISLGINAGIEVGPLIAFASGGISAGVNSNLITANNSSTTGSSGAINQIGQEVKYSLNRSIQEGYDNAILGDSEIKRIVTRRELLNRDAERIRGAEVMWQDKIQDIITGSIPLNFTLPATATKMNFRTADDSLRVRFNSGFSPSVEVDFWFEITEETIKDDY